jgi:hypothetical protein
MVNKKSGVNEGKQTSLEARNQGIVLAQVETCSQLTHMHAHSPNSVLAVPRRATLALALGGS